MRRVTFAQSVPRMEWRVQQKRKMNVILSPSSISLSLSLSLSLIHLICFPATTLLYSLREKKVDSRIACPVAVSAVSRIFLGLRTDLRLRGQLGRLSEIDKVRAR